MRFWIDSNKMMKQVDSMLGKADSILVDISIMRSYLRAHSPAPAQAPVKEEGLAMGGGTPIHYSASRPAGEGA